ncbi:MAG: PaaI family thioesterase [Lachnospiraceae bacterium]|nr:PaaI family thioesterase [Lachnospiraceae bacterium]
MKSIEEIREFFSRDRYASESGAVIEEVGDNYAKCSIELSEMHRNAVGGVMGAVYYTLADFAFAVATNHEEPGVVSMEANISFLGTCKGTKLIAEAKCIRDARTTCYYQIPITDENGNLLTVVNIRGYKAQK